MTTIDLNSDIGEGFSRWTLGDDEAMLSIVSSANIACGFHAGDARTMRATVTTAKEKGVAIGAHVAYRDLAGFGRRNMDVESADLIPEVIYQIGALKGIAAAAGARVTYVKPHGALYNTIVQDERQARDVITAITEVDDSLILLGLAGSTVVRLAQEAGLNVASEAFADRAYNPDGSLVSRREPGSVLHDPTVVAERMLRLVETGTLEAIDGSMVELHADSICVHGDSPGAESMAATVRAQLNEAGVEIASFAPGKA